MLVKCIKDVYSFTQDRVYDTYTEGNNLEAIDNDGCSYIVAYSVMHIWEEDGWFAEHFEAADRTII